MKKYTLTLVALLLSISVFAQSSIQTNMPSIFQEEDCLRIVQTMNGIEVIDESLPPISLFANDVLILNNIAIVSSQSLPLTLSVGELGVSLDHTWSTTATAPEITVETPGKYAVTVTNEYGCKAVNYVHVAVSTETKKPDFIPTSLNIVPTSNADVINIEQTCAPSAVIDAKHND